MRERGLELSQEKTIITRVEDGFDFLGQTVRKYPNGKVLTTVTLERRRGPTIAAAGIQRAPVRSSHSHVVKGRALRWVRLLLLVPIPWAGRTGALPFLTVLAPSARYEQEHNRRHKAVPRWARQLVFLLHRWSPERPLPVDTDHFLPVAPGRGPHESPARARRASQRDALLCRLIWPKSSYEALHHYIEADTAYVALIEERGHEARAGAFATPERIAAVRTKYQTQAERVS